MWLSRQIWVRSGSDLGQIEACSNHYAVNSSVDCVLIRVRSLMALFNPGTFVTIPRPLAIDLLASHIPRLRPRILRHLAIDLIYSLLVTSLGLHLRLPPSLSLPLQVSPSSSPRWYYWRIRLMLKGRALNGWEKNVVGDEASSLDDSWNSVDPAAPSVSTGILATTYRGFPSRAIGSHLQGSRGYWLPFIGVSRAEFSSSSPFYLYLLMFF